MTPNKTIQSFFIPGKFPTLNDVLAAKRQARGRSDGYALLKKSWEQRIILAARQARIKPMQSAHVKFVLHELNRRRDPDNVAAVAIKFALDSLVKGGVLPSDGWGGVTGIAVTWEIGTLAGVWVELYGD
jgi:hypothetical protein